MKWKIMYTSASTKSTYAWSLGYPTKKSAWAAARRLSQGTPSRFFVEKMTAEDEATMRRLEATQ